MFFVIEKTSGDLKIADAFSLKQYAYNTMIGSALDHIRSEVGDRRAQSAQVKNVNSISEDGYWLVVSENNLEATIYQRVTEGGWIQNGISIKPVVQYFIREYAIRQETPIIGQVTIDITQTQKDVPTMKSKKHVHLLDELRERLEEIRKHVALYEDDL